MTLNYKPLIYSHLIIVIKLIYILKIIFKVDEILNLVILILVA